MTTKKKNEAERTTAELLAELRSLPGAEHLPDVDYWPLHLNSKILAIMSSIAPVPGEDVSVSAAMEGQLQVVELLAEFSSDEDAFLATFAGPEGIKLAGRYLVCVGGILGK